MMRRLIALLAIIGFVAGISGCGEKGAVTPSKIGEAKETGKPVEAVLPPPPK
jgi:hypothetical protein